jgi:hypothetical protein
MIKISVEKTFAVAAIFIISLLCSPTWAGTVDLGKHDIGEISNTCGSAGGRFVTSDTGGGSYGCQKGDNIVGCSLQTHNCTGSCSNCSNARRRGKSGVAGILGGGVAPPVATRGGNPAGSKKPKPVVVTKSGGSKTISAIHQNNVQHSGGGQHK